ncbi:nadh dehydrogenase [Stylonychia lemnae]|uniref:NADH dehydrogenase [ubiquinone] iron-sulfur protein 4, mitochondrial n=1 Tax=Stylonychia lemnae TaxID=5949 RepID=A0A078ARL5_STYLE|nr:nadh dehydrogenase [Stylonychia lemnae]|eukprot:CDW85115.1 nadh dehydrogenase [Stylonychia lemnae]
MSRSITAVSKVVNQQALEAIQAKLVQNVWAIKTSLNPNADKLRDGAIQRASVSLPREDIHPSFNTDKVGLYKRPQMDETSSGTAYTQAQISETNYSKNKIARIYHPQRKHVHNHPVNKNIGKHWVIEFQAASSYKSPLMGWTSATTDSFAKTKFVVGSLSAAVRYCESMGWGYDVLYPQTRWHTKKNYSDNFMWKGQPKAEETYD